MARDEIVEEVRAIRKRLLEEAGGTLEGLIAKIKEEEAKSGRKLASLPPRRPRPGRSEAA